MAYVVPRQWSQGEYPTAAEMMDIKDAVDYLYSIAGDSALNAAVANRNSFVQHFFVVHRYRWLLYKGAGRIVDPADVLEPVSLSAGDPAVNSGWTSYDLDQVDWLVPGTLYQVQSVTACMEDNTSF